MLTGRNARIGLLKVEVAPALSVVFEATGNELGPVPKFDLEVGVLGARNKPEPAYG